MLDDWIDRNADFQTRFMGHITQDPRQVETWTRELMVRQEIIDGLADRFAEDEVQREAFLNAGWEMARASVVLDRSLAPPAGKEQVQEWAITLWERLHRDHGILIRDLPTWLDACIEAWGTEQAGQSSEADIS